MTVGQKPRRPENLCHSFAWSATGLSHESPPLTASHYRPNRRKNRDVKLFWAGSRIAQADPEPPTSIKSGNCALQDRASPTNPLVKSAALLLKTKENPQEKQLSFPGAPKFGKALPTKGKPLLARLSKMN